MTGTAISRAPASAALNGAHALLDVAVDVLHHDDGVVDDEADGEHERQQRQKVDRVAERQQREHDADQRQRNGDDGDEGRAQAAEEQEDDDDDDDGRLDQRLLHLADRGVDELGRVVGDCRFEARRQLRHDLGEGLAHIGDDGQRVGRRRRIDADEHRLEPVEHRGGIDVLGSEIDVGDVVEADERIAARGDDEPAERSGVIERGGGVDRHLHEVAFYLSGRRREVVGRERVVHLRRRHAERRHLVGIEPNPHREHLPAEDLRVGDAVDGLQLGLHDARQVVGDLR